MKYFEKASKLKLRFETNRGNVSVEDLWDLPLTTKGVDISLDNLANNLNKELEEKSFVIKNKKNEKLELQFTIVKHIIKIKLKEIEDRKNEALIKEKKNEILNIISDKQYEKLKKESISDLRKMIKEL